MSTAMPERKPFPTASAAVFDVLEAAAKVRDARKDNGGEEQASAPGTAERLD